MTNEPRDEESAIFSMMSDAHPHEMYAAFPERFWELFRAECPGVSREEMERLLEETAGADGQGPLLSE